DRGDRRMSLAAGMEPVGASQKDGRPVRRVEGVDGVEASEAGEDPAMTLAGAAYDSVDRVGRKPAADAEHPGRGCCDRADDGPVLLPEGVERGVESDVVGAQLDGYQRWLRRLHRRQLGEGPGSPGPAAGVKVQPHAQLARHERGEDAVGRDSVFSLADAVPE